MFLVCILGVFLPHELPEADFEGCCLHFLTFHTPFDSVLSLLSDFAHHFFCLTWFHSVFGHGLPTFFIHLSHVVFLVTGSVYLLFNKSVFLFCFVIFAQRSCKIIVVHRFLLLLLLFMFS